MSECVRAVNFIANACPPAAEGLREHSANLTRMDKWIHLDFLGRLVKHAHPEIRERLNRREWPLDVTLETCAKLFARALESHLFYGMKSEEILDRYEYCRFAYQVARTRGLTKKAEAWAFFANHLLTLVVAIRLERSGIRRIASGQRPAAITYREPVRVRMEKLQLRLVR